VEGEGFIYAMTETPRQMMKARPEKLYRKMELIARMAESRGATILGLGAFTSVIGDAGVTLSKRARIGITTGNSLTVAVTIETLKKAAERCGIDLSRAKGMVVGATGSIGRACAMRLADEVEKMYLVSPRPEKLLELGRELKQNGCMKCEPTTDISRYLPETDVIITTTSAASSIIPVEKLKPGCLICDVARPGDISREDAALRPDVLVIESGEVIIPGKLDLGIDIDLPPGIVYACLAETVLLSLEKTATDFTLGRRIEAEQVDEVWRLFEKHGFRISPFTSFGEAVPDSAFERMRDINRISVPAEASPPLAG
jgi:predicted amino acid dehydrogenase